MDVLKALDLAIARREKEVERLQRYVEQFREAERQLNALREARRLVARDLGADDVRVQENSAPPEQLRGRPTSQQSLTADILRVLDLNAHGMLLDEIEHEIESTRGPINRGTLTGLLSRLLKDGRITKVGTATYAPIKSENPPEKAEGNGQVNWGPQGELQGGAIHPMEQGGLDNDEVSI